MDISTYSDGIRLVVRESPILPVSRSKYKHYNATVTASSNTFIYINHKGAGKLFLHNTMARSNMKSSLAVCGFSVGLEKDYSISTDVFASGGFLMLWKIAVCNGTRKQESSRSKHNAVQGPNFKAGGSSV